MIILNWQVPNHIKACTLTRHDILENLALPFPILRLKQVHGNRVVHWHEKPQLGKLLLETGLEADIAYTTQLNTICAIATADCLPVLITNQAGTEVAALHAGWRGLACGVIENGIQQFNSPKDELIAWLGPAICVNHYEVGEEVYQAFVSQNSQLQQFFITTRPGHWLADISGIAEFKLSLLGIKNIYRYQGCTFEDEEQLFSYRREKENAGRLLHLIWIEKQKSE